MCALTSGIPFYEQHTRAVHRYAKVIIAFVPVKNCLICASSRVLTSTRMSMIGFAAKPGTAVLPICSILLIKEEAADGEESQPHEKQGGPRDCMAN